jgi:hypothetical protein
MDLFSPARVRRGSRAVSCEGQSRILTTMIVPLVLWSFAALVLWSLAAPSGDTAGAAPPQAKSAAAALKTRMAYKTERKALDTAMQEISDRIGVPIEIRGADLQLEGLTKNQSFAMNEPEQTVDELLRKIFVLTEQDPGKLVYQIKPKEFGGPDIIIITTRAAVEKRKEKLLDVFAAPQRK